MSGKNPSLAVIIASFNRAEVLRETLGSMCRVDRAGIDVTIYVVDNNSTDNTGKVIRDFMERLPLHYLFEARQGKSAALNSALGALGDEDILLFTDDDVTPCASWFHEVIAACGRWPDHDVFGGKILIAWPDAAIPPWASHPRILHWGFCQNDCGDTETIYPEQTFPFGANLWIRRQVFDSGRLFDKKVGPNPKNRKMGQEIVFLTGLVSEGYEIVYCPAALVHHRIDKRLLEPVVMLRRAFSRGTGLVHMSGLPDKHLVESHRTRWYLRRVRESVMILLRLCKAFVNSSPVERFEKMTYAMTMLGVQIESLREIRGRK